VPPGCPRIEVKLILSRRPESGFLWPIQGVTHALESHRCHDLEQSIPRGDRKIGAYSAAAATSEGFAFAADDIMKSEMRGTISDLKREPLKTP
jgi:hypothetical protein